MNEKRFEMELAPRRVLIRVKVFKKEGEEGYDRKCYDLQRDMKVTLGQEATANGVPFMVDSMIFKITVPFEKEEEAWEIIRDIGNKYFPE